jgi:outer membrane protein insertion porin family
MLNQSKNETMKTYKLLFSTPVVLLLMSAFSFTDKTSETTIKKDLGTEQELTVGKISWEGNTKYSDAMLTRILSVKTGDSYDKAHITERMTFNNNNDDISSLYMDNGYLFFNIDAQEEVVGNTVNLKFKVYEGGTASVDKIIIKGNTKVKTSKVLDMLEFSRGNHFNRSEIIQSQKNIAESGLFNPKLVNINPIPHEDNPSLFDIEFVLIEL